MNLWFKSSPTALALEPVLWLGHVFGGLKEETIRWPDKLWKGPNVEYETTVVMTHWALVRRWLVWRRRRRHSCRPLCRPLCRPFFLGPPQPPRWPGLLLLLTGPTVRRGRYAALLLFLGNLSRDLQPLCFPTDSIISCWNAKYLSVLNCTKSLLTFWACFSLCSVKSTTNTKPSHVIS